MQRVGIHQRAITARMKQIAGMVTITLAMVAAAQPVFAAGDIVLWASDFSHIQGNWAIVATGGAAGGQELASADRGWSALNNALPAPADYVEATFSAPAFTPFNLWLRMRATNNNKFNDSVWVQFADAVDSAGNQVYLTGSSSGLLVNLEDCVGCGDSGW
jgi:hypothetical protein